MNNMKHKILLTLALLITAVGGAWATDETPLLTIESKDYVSFRSGSMTFDDKVTVTFTNEVKNFGNVYGWYSAGAASLLTVAGTNGYTITSCKFYTNNGIAATGYTVEGESPSVYLSPGTVYIDDSKSVEIGYQGITKIEVYGGASASEPDVEVTTNAAEEGATFTEATFAMPAFDATADYELVRDMGYKVAFSGVPTRARLAKDGDGKFHFADGLTFQLLDNIDAANPKDITSAEGITFMVGEVEAVDFEGNTFYQLNKETLVPLADFLADAHLGNYAICAVASTGEYDGSFTSGRIELFQGYEVTVPAGEYATFYKDENLYTEDEYAELYTIASVTDNEAVLSDKIDVVAAGTPMLIFNKGTEANTFLLIPTTEQADDVTAADQFKGTLDAVQMPASDEGTDYYVCTGNAFVWVKSAGTIAANRCWLEIAPSQAAGARRIVFSGSETTGIDAATLRDMTTGDWYDLNGRKLNGMPTKKGVYIMNGRKVVIR